MDQGSQHLLRSELEALRDAAERNNKMLSRELAKVCESWLSCFVFSLVSHR
jgi:hypothetical protein